MNLTPADLLNPAFNFLDAPIQNYGVYLYLVFLWLALLVIAWIFSGGWQRKRPQGSSAAVPPRHHHHDATDEANQHRRLSASRLTKRGTATTKNNGLA